ncbi:MAG: GNAT family protein [Ignavibacteria bacterium]
MNKGKDKTCSLNISINEDLKLELIKDSHAQEIFNLTEANRDYLREWLPWVDATKSVNDTSEFIKISKGQFKKNNGFQLVIKYQDELAGLIGLHYLNNLHKHTEIGYWLAENFTGKGIMTMACRRLTDHCFEDLNLNRVVIKCAEENHRSWAIPERLGFKKEGILRQEIYMNKKFVDHILYAMLREEWI